MRSNESFSSFLLGFLFFFFFVRGDVDTLKSRTRLVNKTEDMFLQLAREHGWEAIKRGWPDFICFKGKKEQPFAVEVKPRLESGPRKGEHRMLKPEQIFVLKMLQDLGLRVYVSDGVDLEPFDREYWEGEVKKYSRPTKTMRIRAHPNAECAN